MLEHALKHSEWISSLKKLECLDCQYWISQVVCFEFDKYDISSITVKIYMFSK